MRKYYVTYLVLVVGRRHLNPLNARGVPVREYARVDKFRTNFDWLRKVRVLTDHSRTIFIDAGKCAFSFFFLDDFRCRWKRRVFIVFGRFSLAREITRSDPCRTMFLVSAGGLLSPSVVTRTIPAVMHYYMCVLLPYSTEVSRVGATGRIPAGNGKLRRKKGISVDFE